MDIPVSYIISPLNVYIIYTSVSYTHLDVYKRQALLLIMDISMALITGVILFQINPKLFAVIVMMTIISIVLVFIFKHPYKKINEEQMQLSLIHIYMCIRDRSNTVGQLS